MKTSNLTVLEHKTDVRETLQAVLDHDAAGLQSVVVLGIFKEDSSQFLATSSCNGMEKAFMLAFFTAWMSAWFGIDPDDG